MGISMGKWPNFEYHVGKWLKYDWFGHLNQPWGPPWTLATIGDMPENAWKWPKWPFSGMSPMVAKGRQGSPRVSKVQGGPQGWVRWVKTKSIIFKSFSDMIFKIGPFPHWNSIKNKKLPLNLSYGSIILKIILWAHFTIWSIFWKQPILGHPNIQH